MSDELFDVVLLSGGGIKGFGELGMLQYHYEKKTLVLDHVKEFVGTSVGSMINILLVCGYTPMEIFTKIYSVENIFSPSDVSNIFEIFSVYGIMSIQPLISIVEDMVRQKLGMLPTLLQLKNMTGKTFTAAAINVGKSRVEYLSYDTYPNLGAVDAVKMSCNLPVVFHRIKYEDNYWIDGGLVDSFPYGAIKNTTGKILGILVTGKNTSTVTNSKEDTFINYLYKIMLVPMDPLTQLKTKNLGPNVKLLIAEFENISILNFNMNPSKKMEMFIKGYNTAKRADEKEILMIPEWDVDQDLSSDTETGRDGVSGFSELRSNTKFDGWDSDIWESH